MCAIVDANVRDLVFRAHPPDARDADAKFFEWITSGSGTIVIGGTKFRGELLDNVGRRRRDLLIQLRRKGRVQDVDDDDVDRRAEQLAMDKSCASDDEHIVALAQVSRARLLYSHDIDLHKDFGNTDLLSNPAGKVYSTRVHKAFTDGHRRLLENRSLCARER